MTAAVVSPFRAFIQGLGAVLRAPLIVVAAMTLTVAVAAPFAAVLGSRLHASLASQPPVSLDETEIDPEWWQEFRAQARGLDATFTPAIVGFAAPLDSLSAVLDGRQPPLAILGPILLSMAIWAFVWGGALRRYQVGRRIGVREFVVTGARLMPRFLAIAGVAAIVVAALYLTVHAVLFGPIHQLLVSRISSERGAFLVRVLLYVVFLAPLSLTALVADYARIAAFTGRASSAAHALRAAVIFLRAHFGAVVRLYLITGVIFIAATVAYGALEIYGGSQVGGWRAIAIGQAYIVLRVALRLTVAASELRLFESRTMP